MSSERDDSGVHNSKCNFNVGKLVMFLSQHLGQPRFVFILVSVPTATRLLNLRVHGRSQSPPPQTPHRIMAIDLSFKSETNGSNELAKIEISCVKCSSPNFRFFPTSLFFFFLGCCLLWKGQSYIIQSEEETYICGKIKNVKTLTTCNISWLKVGSNMTVIMLKFEQYWLTV